MDLEIESNEKSDTLSLVNLPPGAKRVGVKWIYKIKCNEKGEVENTKQRLWLKGTHKNMAYIRMKFVLLWQDGMLLGLS